MSWLSLKMGITQDADKQGWGALHCATQSGQIACIKALVAHGHSVHQTTGSQKSIKDCITAKMSRIFSKKNALDNLPPAGACAQSNGSQ